MQRKGYWMAVMLAAMIALALSQAAYADSPAQAPVQNQVAIDITVNSAGEITVGGVSLKALNLPPLDAATIQMIKNVGSGSLIIRDDAVTVEVRGTPVLSAPWNSASRQALAALAASYGYPVNPDVLARGEEWINSSNLDVSARYTDDMSKPLTVRLAKPVLVDLGPQGQVAIEKGPLAYGIDPRVMQPIERSGAKSAVVCWDQGTLSAQVDGKALPTITLDAKGAQSLVQALNLAIGNLGPFFSAQLGVDVSLPGGTHQAGITCGQ